MYVSSALHVDYPWAGPRPVEKVRLRLDERRYRQLQKLMQIAEEASHAIQEEVQCLIVLRGDEVEILHDGEWVPMNTHLFYDWPLLAELAVGATGGLHIALDSDVTVMTTVTNISDLELQPDGK